MPYPDEATHWCATAVGKNLEFIVGSKNWGICGPTCPLPTRENTASLSFEKSILSKDIIEFETKEKAWRCKYYFILDKLLIVSNH